MQNLLVILFPQLIDLLNMTGKLQNPRTKFWVAIITSAVGGVLLNWPVVMQAIAAPSLLSIGDLITLDVLVVGATQGIYTKYWEDHPARQSLFPSAITPSVAPSVAN